MKTYHGSSKSRASNSTISPVSTRTRKASMLASAPPKALRRLQRPLDDDDDEEEEEIEEELSPKSTASSIGDKRRGADKDSGRMAEMDNSLFIDFDEDGATADSAPAILSTASDRDLDQHPLQSDEMDQLQFELEKSLAQAVVTHRKLRMALRKLTSTSGGIGGTYGITKSSASSSTATINKRKFPKSQQIAKRPPSSTAPATSSIAAKRSRHPGKDRKLLGHESTPTCSRSYYYAQQNHQMPDKFWSFVDQFTAPVTSPDNLEPLRDLIDESDPNSEQSKAYFEMPEPKSKKRQSTASTSTNQKSAGSSQSAAKTSAKAKNIVKTETSTATTRKRAASTAASASTSTSKKGGDNSRSLNGSDKNGLCLGPLTERLIQALLEECGANGEEISDTNKNGQVETMKNGMSTASNSSSSKNLMKTLNLGNLTALENRIKKELVEQGLFDSEDQAERRRSSVGSIPPHSSLFSQFEECSGDDEVTAELKRRQYELACTKHSNHERLTNLLAKAEAQVVQQRREEALRNANEEVLNLCSRYYGVAPTSRKPSGKKERDTLWKALKEREKAISKIKNL